MKGITIPEGNDKISEPPPFFLSNLKNKKNKKKMLKEKTQMGGRPPTKGHH